MAYEMLTRTGRSFWEMTSVMQNAIRKGDYEIAGNALWELLPKYEPYLRKRFLVISAEDCFGIITKEILELSKNMNQRSPEKALSMLCKAKKNRDADYFVCNLMSVGPEQGMSKETIAKNLVESIDAMDVVNAGRYSAELFKKNRKYLWSTLKDIAKVKNPYLRDEFEALHEANETVTKPTEETIFAAKAIVLLWTPKENVLSLDGIRYDGVADFDGIESIKPAEECNKVEGYYPEWTYNWHTTHGKYHLKRDAVHAIENDQRILTPLQENLFDDCTWNSDINACLLKWNPRRRTIPYDDGKRKPEEKFPGRQSKQPKYTEPVQLSMFDELI